MGFGSCTLIVMMMVWEVDRGSGFETGGCSRWKCGVGSLRRDKRRAVDERVERRRESQLSEQSKSEPARM